MFIGILGTFISGGYFFVAFIGADYNKCLWIYKITRFSYCFGKGWVVEFTKVIEESVKNVWKFKKI